MGGGGSAPAPQTTKTTQVTTNTTTNIRDIGLTGQNSVDMAAVINSGAVKMSQVNAKTFQRIIQTTGDSWQRLIGGASDLVKTGRQSAGDIVGAAENVSLGILQTADKYSNALFGASQNLLKETADTAEVIKTGEAAIRDFKDYLPLLIPVAAIAALMAFKD